MDKKKEFDVCLDLLRQVVAARGRDPAQLAQEFVWPVASAPPVESPAAAVSLAPLLTGGGQPDAPTGSGIVPMPAGLTPPKH